MSSDFIARALAQRALKAVGDTQGADAYEVAVAAGFIGSRSAWLASLKGAPGVGKDAYQVAVEAGFPGDRAAWLASLEGAPGVGTAGKDAYEVAVAAGFAGDRAAWLDSLRGASADPEELSELQDQLEQALGRIAVLESPDSLTPLSLDNHSIAETANPGTLVGTILGIHPFEVIEQTDDAGGRLVYADGQIRAGLVEFDYALANAHDITLRRTLAKPGRPPIVEDAILTIEVLEVVTLEDLPLEDATLSASMPAGAEIADLGPLLPGETRAITPDDGRIVFNPDQTKLIRGLTAVSPGQVTFIISRVLEGATNSPHPTPLQVTIDDSSAAYDVLVHNRDGLTTALEEHGAAGGVTIALDPAGVYGAGWTFTLNPAARLTITSASSSVRAKLPSIIFGNSSNISFVGIDHGDDLTTGYCVSLQPGASAHNIWWDNCEFRGAEFDPAGNWHLDSPTYRSGMNTSGGHFVAFRVTNSHLHHLRSCLKPSVWRGACHVIGNHFDAFYEDAVSVAWDYLNPANGTKLNFNYVTRCAGLVSDRYGNTDFVNKPDPQILGPHCDAFQFFEYHDPADGGDGLRDVEVVGNVVFDGESRGVIQLNLMRSGQTWVSRSKVAHNTHVVEKLDAHAPYLSDTWGMYVFNNRVIYRDPGSGANGNNKGAVYNLPGQPKSFLGAQMAAVIETTGPADRGTGATQNILLPNTLASHNAHLEGPFPIPKGASRAQVLTAVKHKQGSPLGHLRDAVDHDARTVNWALEPSWLGFDNFNHTAPGPATSETPWRKLQGGGPGQIIVATNCQYQIADDANGTNASTYTAVEGIVDEGKYIRALANNPAPSIERTCGLTINGWPNTFSITAESVASFAVVDNQGAAYSTTPALPAVAAQKKLIVAIEFMLDTVSAGAQTLLGRTDSGGALGVSSRTGASWRMALKDSSVILVSSSHSPEAGVWHRMLISVDLSDTSGNPANVLKWYDNGNRVTYGGSPGIVTTGTASFNQSDLGALGVLSRAAGLELSDAKVRYVWMDWGAAGYALPDLADPTVRDKFTADTIGTDGSGPTGVKPKVYYSGATADWNEPGGLVNKGTLVLPLTRQSATEYA